MGRRAGEEEEEGKEGDSYFIIFPCRESERTRRIGTGFISSKGGGGEVHVFGLLIFLRGGMGNREKKEGSPHKSRVLSGSPFFFKRWIRHCRRKRMILLVDI